MKFKTLIITVLVSTLGFNAHAQFSTDLPVDGAVKTGTLKNGMTYYVMHNEWPKDRVSFYFVQNVGAILENNKQNGLAHFLEHMAFNGTENYNGKGIINMLEKHGVRFGADVNAYTALDETVYNLSNVPADNAPLIDSCLLVLHDWSGYLLLEGDEIDAERGVIREEWRTRRTSSFRLQSKISKVLYKGSKYAKRDVIGSLDVINNFEYKELKDYYKKWYRPDNQAVIVVGDVDAQLLEQKIQALFSTIPLLPNAAQRTYEHIPDHKKMEYVLATDKEATQVSVSMYFRKSTPLQKDMNYLKQNLINSMCISLLNNRYQEYLENNKAAALSLSGGLYSITRLQEAFYIDVAAKQDQILESFKELLTGIEKAERFGFTQDELDREKQGRLSSYANFLANKDKIDNDAWAGELTNNFLTAEPFLGIDKEYATDTTLLASITLDDLNQAIQQFRTENNAILTVTGPESDDIDYPAEKEYKQIIAAVDQEDLSAYAEKDYTRPLIGNSFETAGITDSFNIEGLEGAKEYVLTNGARVIVYPTELSKDEILFSAYSAGGYSLLDREKLPTAQISSMLSYSSGLGDFSITALQKKLSGKIAQVSPSIHQYSEGLSGSSNQQDFSTLLQLVYMTFENPRFDDNVYHRMIESYQNSLINSANTPEQAFGDTIRLLGSNYSNRVVLFNQQFIDMLDFETAQSIYKDRISNAADFTFVFVGNINEEMLPEIVKYIGNIKSDKSKKETFVNHSMVPADGISKRVIEQEMKVPKSTVYLQMSDTTPYSLRNKMMLYIAGQILSKKYLDIIREEEGGSYGVNVSTYMGTIPEPTFSLTISFDCNPEKTEQLVGIVHQQIDSIQTNPANANDFESIKSALLKRRAENVKVNSFWLNVILNQVMTEQEITDDETYNNTINSITLEDITQYTQNVLKNPKQVEVIMNPKGQVKN